MSASILDYFLNYFIYLFIFGCAGFSLLCSGSTYLWLAGLLFFVVHQSFQRVFRIYFLLIDWFNLLAFQGILKSSPASQFERINSSALCLFYGPGLTSIHDYRKDHTLDYMGLCQQSDVFAF